MTHLLDTSAILAHHLAEAGADKVQSLFDDDTNILGICVITLLEHEIRLGGMGLDESGRRAEVLKYKLLVPVDDAACAKAAELKFSAAARLPSIDAMIAATAALRGATGCHPDTP